MTTKSNIHSGIKFIVPAALILACFMLLSPPVIAQGFSISYSDLEFTVSPGDRISATFQVTNQSGRHQVLRIYSGDWVRIPGDITTYTFSSDPGDEPRSFLGWMSFSPDQLELEPDESRDVFCEVKLPNDPGLAGSFWGVIFVEEVPILEAGNNASDDEAMHVGITTIFRYAVKIYTTVQGTEIREGSFDDLFIEKIDDRFVVRAIFNNTGNIFYRPVAWLEIHDTSGDIIYQQDHIRQTVLPESTREYLFDLGSFSPPPGEYLVMVIADYGGPTLVAAQGNMRLTADDAAPPGD